DDLCGRSYYTQHSFARGNFWKIVLLDRTKGFGRCSIAGKNNKRTPLVKKPFHTLQGVLVHGFERTVAIRRAGISAEIDIIVSGQLTDNVFHDGQTAIAGIKYADGTCFLHTTKISSAGSNTRKQ